MFSVMQKMAVAGLALFIYAGSAVSADRVQPFILASTGGGDVASTVAATKSKLSSAGFEVVGTYTPYADATIVIFTNNTLKSAATKSERGGYGAAMRASVTKVGSEIQVSYTNPIYWANAYRLSSNLDSVGSALKSALGYKEQFSSGEKELTAEDMRGYHYTIMMEYFDDPSSLGSYGDHAEALEVVEENLKAGAGATSMVYKISVGEDTKGNEMTLIGVALKGADGDDCSGDKYIMGKIDKDPIRSTAHLPYEVLVYGGDVEALFARFRIAISWPHLPMMASETGATFMSIMCAPDSIAEALTEVGGGEG